MNPGNGMTSVSNEIVIKVSYNSCSHMHSNELIKYIKSRRALKRNKVIFGRMVIERLIIGLFGDENKIIIVLKKTPRMTTMPGHLAIFSSLLPISFIMVFPHAQQKNLKYC